MNRITMNKGLLIVLSVALVWSMALSLAGRASAQSPAAMSPSALASDSLAGYRINRAFFPAWRTIESPSNWQLPLLGPRGLDRAADVSPFPSYGDLAGYAEAFDTQGLYSADLTGLVPFMSRRGIMLDASLAAAPTDLAAGNNIRPIQGWNATLGAALGSFSINGGYQEIDPGLLSAGAGHYTDNPPLKGATVSAGLEFSRRLSLSANGQFYQGVGQLPVALNGGAPALSSTLPSTSEQLNRYGVGLRYGLSGQYNVDLGYEYDQWNVDNDTATTLGIKAGKPTEQYITIGVGRSFNKYTSLKLLYQILQYNDDGTGLSMYSGGSGLNGNSGVAISQFTMKF